MSEGIRKLIVSAKSQLQQCIEDAENLLKVRVMTDSDFDREESDAKYFMNRLSTNGLLLERYNQDWSNILKDLKGEAKANEKREYAKAMEGENTVNRQKFTVKKSSRIAKTANIKRTKVFNRIHCNT